MRGKYRLTHVLSEIDNIRGAYGEVGRDDFDDGDPSPDIPETLYLLLEEVDIVGRFGGIGGGVGRLPSDCRLEAELESISVGGVAVP